MIDAALREQVRNADPLTLKLLEQTERQSEYAYKCGLTGKSGIYPLGETAMLDAYEAGGLPADDNARAVIQTITEICNEAYQRGKAEFERLQHGE